MVTMSKNLYNTLMFIFNKWHSYFYINLIILVRVLNMRKCLRDALFILFIFHLTPIASAEEPRINLRSSYNTLSVPQVQSILNVPIHSKEEWGFFGHSTINHNYKLKSISEDKVVVDNATGLMWHQSGSDKNMSWIGVKNWIRSLNSRGYGGYHDWRLPTVEEAASLLESGKSNDLYIDSVFDSKQPGIWTGDKHVSGSAWYVNFKGNGSVYWEDKYNSDFVRTVRSVE
jgi:hypothetical protein